MEGYQVTTLEDVRRDRRHLHHRDRQQEHHHRRPHEADEGQGDRRQHRPLRQRDRHGRPRAREAASSASTSSRSTTSACSRATAAQRAGAGRRPPAEPRLRHRPPELRDVGVVHQPGDGADRAAPERHGQATLSGTSTRRRSTSLPKKLDEEVARLHLDKLGVKLTTLTQGAGRLHRRAGGRAVQAGALPVLGWLGARGWKSWVLGLESWVLGLWGLGLADYAVDGQVAPGETPAHPAVAF